MQFREQGRKVQCIRSTYDPATKRSHQKVIASIDRYVSVAPGDVLELLDAQEQSDLAAWLKARQERQDASHRATALRLAGYSLDSLAAAVRVADAGTINDDQAAKIWHGLAAVAKALRKAGHPKPRIRGVKTKATREGQ